MYPTQDRNLSATWPEASKPGALIMKARTAQGCSAPQLGQTTLEGGGARKEKIHHVQVFLLIDTGLKGLWLIRRSSLAGKSQGSANFHGTRTFNNPARKWRKERNESR
jgi:hypothetical protein